MEVFDADRLRAAREHLTQLIGRMRGGEFEVTEEPLRGALLRLPRGRPPVPAAGVEAPAVTRRPKAEASRAAVEAPDVSIAVFGYASLASPESASQTIGRPVEFAGVARLAGWRRAWTLGREQAKSEKTFARADGSIPRFCLGLNVEPDPDAPAPNGVLIELTEAELDRLDLREIRYDRVDVTAAIASTAGGRAPSTGSTA